MSSANPPAPQWSLRRRVLLRVLAVVAVLWIGNAALVLYSALHETAEDLDGSLRRAASLLLAFAEHEYAETAGGSLAGVSASEELPRGGLLYQIWDARGQLLLRSADAPFTPLSPQANGYHDLYLAGQSWRLYVAWNDTHTLHLLMAEPQSHRHEILQDLSLSLLLPGLLGAPLLAFLTWAAVSQGLRPARAAATLLANRGLGDFSPVHSHQLPDELHPLLAAFNSLLARLAKALESERSFTEDVAHELRTPLAAIRLQGQIAQRATNPQQGQAALLRLISGVDRTSRVIDQLLTLARLDPRYTASNELHSFMLSRIVEETTGEFEALIHSGGHTLGLTVSPGLIRSSPQAVYIVLRNLLDNALRYSPKAGHIQLEAQLQQGQLQLKVSDQGPGIPLHQRKQVLERFSRLGNQAQGSGLGLFIVQRISEALYGSITISDGPNERGTTVCVQWPAQAAESGADSNS